MGAVAVWVLAGFLTILVFTIVLAFVTLGSILRDTYH